MKKYEEIVRQSIKDNANGIKNSVYGRVKEFTDNLTKRELINLMKEEEIYYKKDWSRELLAEKYYGMANTNYAMRALMMSDIDNETFQDFSKRLYVRFYMDEV